MSVDSPIPNISEAQNDFAGDKPDGSSDKAEDERFRTFSNSINWNALCEFASEVHDDMTCALDPDYSLGQRSVVRTINFVDGSRWVAKLRMTKNDVEKENSLVKSEFDCLRLVKECSGVPVPEVHAWLANENKVGAPVMLMECLPGKVVMDTNRHSSDIPQKHEFNFWVDVARIQAEIAGITFSQIGSVVRLEDGSYKIGPLPDLGGPFGTATQYLEAWAKKQGSDVRNSELMIKDGEDSSGEMAASIDEFPSRIHNLAATIPLLNEGPFPLYHPDFSLANIIVNDNYKILGVIDWEDASTVPWDLVHSPFSLSPKELRGPRVHEENGEYKWKEVRRQQCVKRNQYLDLVREAELFLDLPSALSDILADEAAQDLAMALREWNVHKCGGFYTRVLDAHHERFCGDKPKEPPLIPPPLAESLATQLPRSPFAYLGNVKWRNVIITVSAVMVVGILMSRALAK